MNLCCEVNPTKECKTCHLKFCEEHTYTEGNFSWQPLGTSECFLCYDSRVRNPFIDKPRAGLTASELYKQARQVCPKGYLTVAVTIEDFNPGKDLPTLVWTLYHSEHKSFRGVSPEQLLASFTAAVNTVPDSTNITVNSINL